MTAIKHRTLGVNFKNQAAAVRVWAPQKDSVSLKLVNSGKMLKMQPKAYGYWVTETEELKPGDAYVFVLDGKEELPDPASLHQPEGVHKASSAVDLSTFEWSDGGWENPDLEEYIIYELHIGTFTKEGTFEAAIEKLDYLVDLGVTAIEILPVAQFPGSRNWGYDGVYPYAVQHSYGGPEKLQRLVNSCHHKGLAVILDVVYNHQGPEGNYFSMFAPYFTDKYNTPWGQAINFDDAWSDGVRKYYLENVLMWFRDFHIDALRLDAVHAIKDFSPKHILREMKEATLQLEEEYGKRHHLTIEFDLNDSRFINSIDKCGYGMDAQWIDEFHHALRVTTGEPATGYYSDFEGIGHLAKAYRDAYVFDGIYSHHRKRTFGNKVSENPGKQFIAFSQNHDQVGNRMLGERTSQLVSHEMLKVLAAAVIFSPYIPMLFMGEEWGASSPFQYFVSHTDPDLVEAVRKGRKAEFAAFHNEGEAPDPQAEETYIRSKLKWNELNHANHKNIFHYYKELLDLRSINPVLSRLDRNSLRADHDEGQQTLFLHRWSDDQHVIVLMNFSKKEQPVHYQLPSKKNWSLIWNSVDKKWNGSFNAPDTISSSEKLTLPAESVLVYQNI